MFFNIGHLPLKQKQFGAEGWTHGPHHAVATWASGAIEQIVLHHRKNGNGGEISALAKSVPGCSQSMGRQTKTIFHGSENLGAAAMKDIAADVSHTHVVVSEEALDGVAKLCFNELRNFRGEDDAKAFVIDGPSRQMLGVGKKRGTSINDARTRILNAGGPLAVRCLLSSQDHGCGAVTEESAGDDMSHGVVILLPGEGAEFDREQERILFGVCTHIINGARNSGGAANAAETEDRGALNVPGEAHAVDEAGVDAWTGDTGV